MLKYLSMIIIAPDKFKGSMTAVEAARCIARGIKAVFPFAELTLLPLSDGGEGLVESLVEAAAGSTETVKATNPLGYSVEARLGIINDKKTAVIEMASASGLTLIPEELRNPAITTTYGTGELIKAALDRKCSELIIGIGGSATNDGGTGMARALGVKFLDRSGQQLKPGGAELNRLDRIDMSEIDSRLDGKDIKVACDVSNPLTGPQGASHIYGPQKGATPDMVEQLEQALVNFARIVERDLGLNIDSIPGAGAAGGLGAGLIAFLGAKLHSGIDLVLDTLEIDKLLPGCTLLITGEGRLDSQSVYGKTPIGAARRARSFNVPVLALAGSLDGSLDLFRREGITASFAIADGPLSLEESKTRGRQLLEAKTAELMHICKHFQVPSSKNKGRH